MKEIAAQVGEGTVDAGILYASDAVSAGLDAVDAAAAELCGQVVYPAAVLKRAGNPDAALDFLDFLKTPDAGEVFRAVGLSPLN